MQQLVEHAPLIVGDDAIADAREHHGAEIGGESPGPEDDDREEADDDDAVEIAIDPGLVVIVPMR